jgi:hypothetical protein
MKGLAQIPVEGLLSLLHALNQGAWAPIDASAHYHATAAELLLAPQEVGWKVRLLRGLHYIEEGSWGEGSFRVGLGLNQVQPERSPLPACLALYAVYYNAGQAILAGQAFQSATGIYTQFTNASNNAYRLLGEPL